MTLFEYNDIRQSQYTCTCSDDNYNSLKVGLEWISKSFFWHDINYISLCLDGRRTHIYMQGKNHQLPASHQQRFHKQAWLNSFLIFVRTQNIEILRCERPEDKISTSSTWSQRLLEGRNQSQWKTIFSKEKVIPKKLLLNLTSTFHQISIDILFSHVGWKIFTCRHDFDHLDWNLTA